MDADDLIIGEISKNENDVLRISVRDWKGRKYIDIRKYFRNGKGHMIPTQSGITVGKKSIDDLIIYLRGARQALNGEKAF